MTYPSPQVAALLAERFVCTSVDESAPKPRDRELIRRCRLLWSPGLVFFEPRGAELRRVVGFRPPHAMLGELHLVLGLTDLLYRRFDAAAAAFELAAGRFEEAEGAAEALYWRGIAVYRAAGRDHAVLRRAWERIRERFPNSTWWPRAEVWDTTPTGRRP